MPNQLVEPNCWTVAAMQAALTTFPRALNVHLSCSGKSAAAAAAAAPLPHPAAALKATTTHRAALHVCHGLKENVAQLAPIDDVQSVRLTSPKAQIDHTIPNAPGKKASVAIYSHLAGKHGGQITAEAAQEGLQLYGEFVEEAKQQPGSHPNIDLLLDVLDKGLVLTVEVNTC